MSTIPHEAAPTIPPGTTVGGYRVDGVLGHGGMGVVYEATQLSLERTVALKVLAPHLGEDPLFRKRFRREGMLQAALEHPHIVTVHEAGESEQGLFIAMRLIRGPRLKDLITASELDAARTLQLLAPIAAALDTAHDSGLIHRDVKPQNILIGAHDHPYLADFGLTKLPGDRSLTGSGEFVGTLDYVAPEQIFGEPPSPKTDVYAFGAVLYECLTGSVPYPAENQAAVLYGHLSEPPPGVTERNPALPAALDEVIARAMAKDPDERPEVASAVIADAERAFGDHVPSVRPRTVARAPKRRAATPTTTHLGRGMRRLLPIKALALAAVTGALVAGALLGHSGGAAPKVSAATPGPPSSTYAGALGRITAALNANRVTARRALREAKGAKAQARTADTLSGAYASASASLRSVRPPSDASRAHAAAVAALAKAEGAYQRLARAISTSDPRAYARAGAAATAAETALARALASLRPLGYRLR